MGIKRQGERLVATWPSASKGWETTGPLLSPWRTAIIAKDLDALVNSDLITSLCPPPRADLVGATWIKPGRALWHWWAVGDPLLPEQRAWVDAAAELGFEYYLVDDGWKKWKDGDKDSWTCLKEVVDYAKAKKVGILVWVACRDLWNPKARRDYLTKVAATGALGIKIDYFPPGHAGTVQWMEGALADTADLKLLCNFHGCVKPSGRNRTWPHELTREAVRGHEWHIKRYKRVMPFDQYTIIPFTRFVQGPADFTPTVFDPQELLGYTWANEIAQAVVFTSPVQHYADHYRFLLANPNRDLLMRIPVVWDETRVLPGTRIGQVVGMARRRGTEWFLGVMNGASPTHLDISLGFLGDGRYRMVRLADVADRDDATDRSETTVGKTDSIALDLRKGGGSWAVITPIP
jgi:alpha-glucosidase